MNAPTQRAESSALSLRDPQSYEVGQVTDAAALILGPAFDRVQAFATLMAKGSVTVPRHLAGNMGDCMAITIQALGWKMNPFAVAQKTHISQSGALGYEAQLVSAALVSSGAIQGEPDYEAIGDWSKVLGKVEERQGKERADGKPGGKYYVATYTKKDEEGLGVKVKATLRGETKPRELTVMMSQAYPRFSTQWATDPFQQLCYLAVRKWGRLHSPGAILGVYTPDELDGEPAPEKFMGPADVVKPGAAAAAATTGNATPEWSDAELAKREPKIREFYGKGKTAEDIIAFYASKGTLTPAQQQKIRSLAPAAKPADTGDAAGQDQVTDAEPKLTYADVAGKIARAGSEDDLAVAEDLIGSVANHEHRAELIAHAKARRAELSQGA